MTVSIELYRIKRFIPRVKSTLRAFVGETKRSEHLNDAATALRQIAG
jgi:hypothetical protein